MITKTRSRNKVLKFTVPIIVKPDSIGFHAYSPALKGLHMDGDTQKEALNNARKAARDYLEILIEDGLPIPLNIISEDGGEFLITDQQEGHFVEEIKITIR